MNWSNETLEEIIKKLPKRTKSYLEHKTDRIRKAQTNEPDLDFYPKTLHEMELIINEAIDHAKTHLVDLKMFGRLNSLHEDWIVTKNGFLVMSVLVASLKYRDKEEIESFLKQTLGDV
jgi:hypothetical protein